MIEIPESQTLVKQINETIKGKKISSVIAGEHPHKFAWFFEDPAAYENILKGKTIDDAKAVNHFVEIRAGNTKILFQEGINLRYITDPKDMPKKHQLLIQFEDDSILCASVQMYGGLICFKDTDFDNKYYKIARERLSPLNDKFTFEYFKNVAKIAETKKNISLKALIATEQRIPGLGNGVLQDILFNANLHPKHKYNQLTDDQKESLFTSIKNTLKEMTNKGGRDTEKNLFGKPGGYVSKVCKNTLNQACKVCGTTIQKAAYMGGSIYFCSGCQKL